MKIAWLTDLHLNHVRKTAELKEFFETLPEVDAFVITGDIGEAGAVEMYLRMFDRRGLTYFVLGNHDYYGSSIEGVREAVRELCWKSASNLNWMVDEGVVQLTENACLVGHDGWGDGRLGDYEGSTVRLNDFRLISDLRNAGNRLAALHDLGDEAADHFRVVLPRALKHFQHVIVLTHVPPFREACWHEGSISSDDWLPYFACKAAGDALREAMLANPDRHVTVLCGHTHSSGEAQILPNLRVLTGGAVYGKPQVQRIFDLTHEFTMTNVDGAFNV